jgi:MSHA biogenesis protein MshJ
LRKLHIVDVEILLVKALIQETSEKIGLLSRRERVIMLVMALAITGSFGQFVLIDPLLRKEAEVSSQIEAAKQELDGLNTEAKLLTFALQVGPNQQERQQIASLEAQLINLNKALSGATQELLPPARMIRVLEEVLVAEKKLKLVSMHNLPVEVLVAPDESSPASVQVGLYKHGLQMVFSGPYKTVYDFLETIEQKSWKFFWESMIYEVNEYPNAKVTIEVYTLSTEKGWVGV